MSSRLNAQVLRAWQEQGIKFFTPARGMRSLVALLGSPVAQVGVGECDWYRFVAAKPLPNALYNEVFQGGEARAGRVDLVAVLALPKAERTAAIEDLVRQQVAAVLHLDDVEMVDPDVQFVQLGLDSLMAMELRSALQNSLRLPLPASVAFDYPTTESLVEFIDQQLVPVPDAENG
jgi:acyl carrier protein